VKMNSARMTSNNAYGYRLKRAGYINDEELTAGAVLAWTCDGATVSGPWQHTCAVESAGIAQYLMMITRVNISIASRASLVVTRYLLATLHRDSSSMPSFSMKSEWITGVSRTLPQRNAKTMFSCHAFCWFTRSRHVFNGVFVHWRPPGDAVIISYRVAYIAAIPGRMFLWCSAWRHLGVIARCGAVARRLGMA